MPYKDKTKQREYSSAYTKRWRKNNPDKVKIIERKSNLKRYFGVTVEHYESLSKRQGNVCAICGMVDETNKRLAVDHCHTTNRVRGLLCSRCNLMLGQARDSIATLQAAINYLDSEVPVEKEK